MKGGIILKKNIRKLLICCLAILCFVGLLAMGVKATGDETGNCTLESVTLKMDNVEQTFTGDLKRSILLFTMRPVKKQSIK